VPTVDYLQRDGTVLAKTFTRRTLLTFLFLRLRKIAVLKYVSDERAKMVKEIKIEQTFSTDKIMRNI